MAVSTEIIEAMRQELRLTTNDFDGEIERKINEALDDMNIAGVNGESVSLSDNNIMSAVTAYLKFNFGSPEADEYARYKRAYEQKKAQLGMTTGYTKW